MPDGRNQIDKDFVDVTGSVVSLMEMEERKRVYRMWCGHR